MHSLEGMRYVCLPPSVFYTPKAIESDKKAFIFFYKIILKKWNLYQNQIVNMVNKHMSYKIHIYHLFFSIKNLF